MKKFLRLFVFTILVILFLGTCITFWIYASERGLNWAVNIARPYLPNTITLGKVSGTLDTKLYIENLAIKQPDIAVELTGVTLECDWTELLYSQVNCQNLVLNKLKIVSSSTPTEPKSRELPKLEDFELPINIQIASAEIKHIIMLQKNQLADDKPSPLTIDSLTLKSLQANRGNIKFHSLSAEHQKHQVNITGTINTQANWPINIEIAVQPNDKSSTAELALELELSIKGEVKQAAQYKLSMASPLPAKTSGSVYWQNGLQLKDGKLQLNQYSLKQQSLVKQLNSWTIDIWEATYQMEWPKFQVDLQTKILHPADTYLTLNTSLVVDNIQNWTNKTRLPLKLEGKLTESAIHQINADIQAIEQDKRLNNKPKLPNKALPLDLSLHADIEVSQNKLSIELYQTYLNELKVEVNFNSLASAIFDEYQGSIVASLPKTFKKFGLFASDIDAEITFSKVDHNQFPSMFIQANASQLAFKDLAINQLQVNAKNVIHNNGDMKFNTIITSSALKLANNTIEDLQFALTGNQVEHQLKLDFNYQPFQAVSLGATGALDFKSNPKWLISALKIRSGFEENSLDLIAQDITLSENKQSVNNFCLHFNGQVCGKFTNTKNRQQVTLGFEQLDSQPLSRIANQLISNSDYQLEALVDGEFELTAEDFKLLNFKADINTPNLKFKYPQGETNLVDLKLQSAQSSNAIQVNWNALSQQTEISDLNAKVYANQGQAHINISSLENISVDLNINNISWNSQISTSQKIAEIINIDSLTLTTKLKKSELQSQFSFNINSNDYIKGDLTIDDMLNSNSIINGDLDVNLKNFAWLKQWQSRIDQVEGNWQQQVQIKGSLNKPLFYGEGKLVIDRFVIQELGLDISDSEIELNGDHQLLKLNGMLKNKQGKLNIQGEMKVYPDLEANLKVYGNKLLLIDTVDNRVVASPNMTLSLQQQLLEVGGKITIDEANVKIINLPKQAVKVSDDQIIIGETTKDDAQLEYKINIVLATGDKVSIDGFGLTSKVKGDLTTLIQSNQPIKINGQLSLVDGQFEKYKQVLNIDEGQLLFLGQPDNPGIQFKASRSIDNIKVGIIADGSVNNPRLTLYSQPAMSDEQILSLLITGRSIESLNKSEGNALANTAINLGIEGANKLAHKIGEALGLNSLSLTSKTKADSTRVELGAKINDQLNLSYGTTISSSNEIQAGWIIQYQLTPNISFEAISGEEMSANLIYKKTFKSDDSDD